jgi:DNA-directed RNA polymerase subunit M/transcription elongation factor TFIIS
MEMVDRVEEWQRLQASYGSKTDEELQALAEESDELTELAQQVLRSEITRRGLPFKLKELSKPPGFNPEPGELDPSELEPVVVRRVWDVTEARQVKGILDDAGIPSFLGPDNLDDVETYPSSSSFGNGIDLKVRYVDNQRALYVLSRSLPSEPQDQSEYVPVCPKCNSREIVFESLDEQKAASSAFDAKFNWKCDACGYQWKDDGIEKEGQ